MKILVAIDSFKGSATSTELNEAVKQGILTATANAEVLTVPVADGGEGTLASLKAGLGGELISVETVDLLLRQIQAEFLMTKEKIAVIEAASVVGIDKIRPSTETIQQATTFGLGKLVLTAMEHGAQEIILTLGGTGTSDGGLGLLQGLGGSFEDLPNLSGVKITGLADVTNVYSGEQGYAKVFGAQKGGTSEIIAQQDETAQEIAKFVKGKYDIDLQKISGTGAAGGLGGAIVMLGGTIEAGFPKIAELLQLENKIKTADLVITGEGRMDAQTAQGKLPHGMAKLAKKYAIPTIAFCGALADELGEMDQLLLASYSIQRAALPIELAVQKERTLRNIQTLAKNVIKTLGLLEK